MANICIEVDLGTLVKLKFPLIEVVKDGPRVVFLVEN